MPASMPPSGEELAWWRDAISALGGALAAVACWSFLAGRKSKEFEQKFISIETKQNDLENRTAAIEGEQKNTVDECLIKRKEIIEELKVEILRIVQQAMSSAAIERVEQTGEIRTNIAVIQALLGEMQEDMRAMSERLDRRHMNVYPPPHGERRDQ